MRITRQKSFLSETTAVERSLRWYLLLWLGIIYLWTVSRFTVMSYQGGPCDQCTPVVVTNTSFSPSLLAGFTFLLCLLGLLVFLSMSGKSKRVLSWVSLLVQGWLVLLIGLFPDQQHVYMALSLYLALVLEALAMLRRARAVMLITLYYAGLFCLDLLSSLFLSKTGLGKPAGVLFSNTLWFEPLLGMSANYLSLFLFAGGYIFLYMQQFRAHAQLASAHRELLTSAAQIQELTVIMERQRMARELHDTLVQNLAGLIRQLDVASSLLGQKRIERAEKIIQESSASARGALVEARCAIGGLRANLPTPAELRPLVQEEIERFTLATGIVCQVQLAPLALTPAELCEHVLRAVSEGLTNIARHAQARQSWVRVSTHKGSLVVEIGDDGIGFTPSVVMQGGHYGLLGLRERMRLAHGQLEIRSKPGQGTALLLSLPLSQAEGERAS
ncbi:hypothetical protein ccbrp13_00840 [Ktedonobacteria bacterium brp13]|nr:hypothetical protein ccbrp13_00840 [Ktedonobacteria bacterium brp13]